VSRWRRVALLVLLCPVFSLAESPSAEESALKAALVYKLAQFVDWPQTAGQEAFAFCLLGEDVFGGALDRLQGRQLDKRPVVVRHYRQSEAVAPDCRVLFIGPDKTPFEREILARFAGRPMLTLGESEHFAENGGMIQLRRSGRKFAFVINPGRARRDGLTIAAPLLSMSTIVETREEMQP
jgi:hypothetical protein